MNSKSGNLQRDIPYQSKNSVYTTKRYFANRLQGGTTGKVHNRTPTCQERMWHINELELVAVKFAFLTISSIKILTSVHIQINNMVALTYLKEMWGAKNKKMTKMPKEIWEVLLSNGITITVEYLPKALNKRADQESQPRTENSEWILCKNVF